MVEALDSHGPNKHITANLIKRLNRHSKDHLYNSLALGLSMTVNIIGANYVLRR